MQRETETSSFGPWRLRKSSLLPEVDAYVLRLVAQSLPGNILAASDAAHSVHLYDETELIPISRLNGISMFCVFIFLYC